MSQNRKYLKILSLAQFVVGVAVVVLACVSKFGAGVVAGSDLGETLRLYLDFIAFVVLAFLTIASSVTGIHGANRPSALGSHRLLSLLGAIAGLIACVVSAGNGLPFVPALALVIDIDAAWLDTKVRKELDERS